MDIDQVIIAHLLWKAKTTRYCEHPDGSLDPQQVGDDGLCAFGKWMRAEGEASLGTEAFQALEAEHLAFHQAAAALVSQANRGELEAVTAALKPQGDFGRFTYRLVTTLKKQTRLSA